jgi:hypothetical protein
MEVHAKPKVAAGTDLDIRIEVNDRGEIVGETRIRATLATVFALLTEAHQIMTWLAHYAEIDARVGGVFCLADPSGLWRGRTLRSSQIRKLCWPGVASRDSDLGSPRSRLRCTPMAMTPWSDSAIPVSRRRQSRRITLAG